MSSSFRTTIISTTTLFAVALVALVATPAHALDRHTVPTVSKVKRNEAGRVVSCTVECALLEQSRGRFARLSLHQKGQYAATLSRLQDDARRKIISGTFKSRGKGNKALWVSDTIEKQGNSTPVSIAIDFGAAGLEGSDDPKAEFIFSSAHASMEFGPNVSPHVHAAETAPIQAPDATYYFTWPKGTKVKATAAE